jgi:hypothetical protein
MAAMQAAKSRRLHTWQLVVTNDPAGTVRVKVWLRCGWLGVDGVYLLTMKIRQPSHEFTFGVGMSFIPYPLVLTPVV